MKNYVTKILKTFKIHAAAKSIKSSIDSMNDKSDRKKMIQFYSNFITKGDLCFDVGANIGNRTEIFLELGAKVICVEPQQACLNQLKKKFGNNENVKIIDKAVGDKEGTAEIAICEDEPTISTMSDKWKSEGRFSKDHTWSKTQEIPLTTLDILIEEFGLPKFCKIDVEGFEGSVIRGLTKPIPFISFEFTREFFEDAKLCINHLLTIENVKFNCSIGESRNLRLDNWVTHDILYKELDTINDEDLWGDIYAKFI